jgi:hypothetical protein
MAPSPEAQIVKLAVSDLESANTLRHDNPALNR